jgi:uncharacterized iron-regulated protein
MNCRPAVALLLSACLLSACAHRPAPGVEQLLGRVLPTPLLLLGEQHDAPEHQALQRDVVLALASRAQLGALVMEMVEQGRSTQGLPQDADEARVRSALHWTDETGWPWPVYGPVVMAAVRSGVPVLGGNLPRAQMRGAMGNATLDTLVADDVLQRQRTGIQEGHCDLLPPSQIAPMTRIQLARDQALAQTAVRALIPGKTVVLVAGNGHVRSDLGVPLYLPAGVPYRVVMAQAGPSKDSALPADAVWNTPALPPRDHCAELRQQMKR